MTLCLLLKRLGLLKPQPPPLCPPGRSPGLGAGSLGRAAECSGLGVVQSGSAERGRGWSWTSWKVVGGRRGAVHVAWRAEGGTGGAAVFEFAEGVVVLGTGAGTGTGREEASGGGQTAWTVVYTESEIPVGINAVSVAALDVLAAAWVEVGLGSGVVAGAEMWS